MVGACGTADVLLVTPPQTLPCDGNNALAGVSSPSDVQICRVNVALHTQRPLEGELTAHII